MSYSIISKKLTPWCALHRLFGGYSVYTKIGAPDFSRSPWCGKQDLNCTITLKIMKKKHFQSIWYDIITVIYIVVHPNRMVCHYGLGMIR